MKYYSTKPRSWSYLPPAAQITIQQYSSIEKVTTWEQSMPFRAFQQKYLG